jgi:putative drug exporter of the RND superfamily
VAVGGQVVVFRQISAHVEADLGTAEAITFPIVLFLPALVFGSVVAATLPLAVAAISVAGTLLVLLLLTLVTDVSVFSINLTTGLGVGLGIDYSLFIVSRFREELHAGLAPADAVVRTVQTAGRTVLFSGLTVASSLAALLVFPMYFLRSFAYAGIAVVALACVGALAFLPSLLALAGGDLCGCLLQPALTSEGATTTACVQRALDERAPGRSEPRQHRDSGRAA